MASLVIQKYDDFARTLVMRRKQDLDGNIIGSHHSNSLLDTRIYEVQFQDGSISKYTANLIAEKLYSCTYPDGNKFLLLNDILDHKSTEKAMNPEYAFEGDPSKRKYKKTTSVWKLLVEWSHKKQPQLCISLKDLKESYSIQVVEYAKANGILS